MKGINRRCGRSLKSVGVCVGWLLVASRPSFAEDAGWSHVEFFSVWCGGPGLAAIQFSRPRDNTLDFAFVCVVYDLETAGRNELRITPVFPGQYCGCIETSGEELLCSVGGSWPPVRRFDPRSFEIRELTMPDLPGRPTYPRRMDEDLLVFTTSDFFPGAECYCLVEWDGYVAGKLIDWICPGGFWGPMLTTDRNVGVTGPFLSRYVPETEQWSIAHIETKGKELFFEHVLFTRRIPSFAHPTGEWFIGVTYEAPERGLYLVRRGQEDRRISQLPSNGGRTEDIFYLASRNTLVAAYNQRGKRTLLLYDLGKEETLSTIETDADYTLIGWNEPTNELILYCEPKLMRCSLDNGQWSLMAEVHPPKEEPRNLWDNKRESGRTLQPSRNPEEAPSRTSHPRDWWRPTGIPLE